MAGLPINDSAQRDKGRCKTCVSFRVVSLTHQYCKYHSLCVLGEDVGCAKHTEAIDGAVSTAQQGGQGDDRVTPTEQLYRTRISQLETQLEGTFRLMLAAVATAEDRQVVITPGTLVGLSTMVLHQVVDPKTGNVILTVTDSPS